MILGIDFSLTATGVCAITDGEAECITVRSGPGSEWWMHPDRVASIADKIAEWAILLGGVPAWTIESPSFGSKGQLDKLYSGWWMLVDALMLRGWDPPLRVTPSQLKKYATGRGNAAKDEVLLAVARRFPDVAPKNNNETDALVLAAIGAAAYGEPFAGELTKYQQDIVDAVRAGGKDKT